MNRLFQHSAIGPEELGSGVSIDLWIAEDSSGCGADSHRKTHLRSELGQCTRRNGVKSCNHTLGHSPLVMAPISLDRLLTLAAKRRGWSGLDPVLNT